MTHRDQENRFQQDGLIVVASDSHGQTKRLYNLEKAYPKALLYLHCGDLGDDPKCTGQWRIVKGNNDHPDHPLKDEEIAVVGDHRILVTHGHRYPLKNRIDHIVAQAKEQNCDVVVFGHTHRPFVSYQQDILILNPGSLYRNHVPGGLTYGLLRLDGTKLTGSIESYYELQLD